MRDMSRGPRHRHRPSARSEKASVDVDVFPTREDISAYALKLFVASDRRLSRHECWLRAEEQLLDHAARRVTR